MDEGSVIALLWALTSMPEEVLAPEKTEPRVLVSDLLPLRQNIWSRFQALYTRLSFEETFEGESSASSTGWYYVPLIELALLDDCLSLFEEELLVFSRGNLESYVLHRAKIREIVNLTLLLVAVIFGNVVAWNVDVVPPAALRAGLAFVDTEIALYLLARGTEVFDKRLPFLPTSRALLHGNLRALTKLVLAGAVVALLAWLTGR